MRLSINKVKIYQIGRFKDEVEFEFGPHVTGIVGNNGTGKSTILSSLYFALTGKYQRLCRKKKEEAINIELIESASQAIHPYVEVELSDNRDISDKYILRRYLLPSKGVKHRSFLKNLRTGETVFDNDLDNYISEHFFPQTTFKAISDLIFVQQGQTTVILTAPPSLRSAIIQRAIGIDNIERGRNVLSGLMGEIFPKFNSGLDFVKNEISRLKNEKSKVAQEIHDLEQSTIPDEEFRKIEEYCNYYYKKYDKFKRYNIILSEIGRIEKQLSDIQQKESKLPEYREILEWNEKYNVYRQKIKKLEDLTREVNKINKEIDRLNYEILKQNVKPPEPVDVEEYYVNYFKHKSLEKGKCLICGSESIEDLGNNIERLQEKIKDIETKMYNFIRDKEDYEKISRSIEQKKGEIKAHKLRLENLEKERKEIGEVIRVDPPPPQKVQEAEREYRTIEGLINLRISWQNDLQNLKIEKESLEKELGDVSNLDEKLYQRYNQKRVQNIQAVTQLKEMKKRYEQIKTELEIKQLELERLEYETKINKKIEEFYQDCKRVYTAFASENLPKIVIARSIHKIRIKINEILRKMKSNMEILIDDDGDFHVRVDGKIVPWVSEGQTVTLALAWRLALCPDVGFLCLDEPTYGVDKRRLSGIRNVLEEWKDYGLGQLIIVSHDNRIIEACDRIIDLNQIQGDRDEY